MHIHISWITAAIIVFTFVAVIGTLNLFARAHPASRLSQAWALISSAG